MGNNRTIFNIPIRWRKSRYRWPNESITMWLKDMADFKELPKEWPEIARKGVEEELKNRSPEIGNDEKSLAEYRHKMLVELLKLHGKL